MLRTDPETLKVINQKEEIQFQLAMNQKVLRISDKK